VSQLIPVAVRLAGVGDINYAVAAKPDVAL